MYICFCFCANIAVDSRVTRCQVICRTDTVTHRVFRGSPTMKLLVGLLVTAMLVSDIVCPPVNPGVTGKINHPDEDLSNSEPMGLAYEHYLKEVVSALEKDDDFKKKLEAANTSDIVSGEIARHLEFVSHNVRTKLDELKRSEVDRLQAAIRQKQHIKDGVPVHQQINEFVGHVDHRNPHTFEVSDLEKLIKKATGDLNEIDEKRRSEFKEYEMEKKMGTEEKLAKMTAEQREAEKKRMEEMKKKHNDHPKVNHPGSKDQLEDVWEEQDGMDKKDFDPKTFFYLHDVNGDGFLDENEVESLFQKELDKLYDPNAPEDDQMERYEEMNRMREHVMKEIDKNDDRMVSLDEFVESTKRASYEKEEGWEDLEDNEQFSDEEFEKFQKEYHEKHGMPEEVHNEVPHQEVHQQQQQHQEQQPPVQQGHQQGPGQQPGQHIQPPQGQPIRQPEQHQQQPPS